jgi:hypothetical protein
MGAAPVAEEEGDDQGSQIWSLQSIRSVLSYEDPILDLPLPWRERIEVRGSFVCLVMNKGIGYRV